MANQANGLERRNGTSRRSQLGPLNSVELFSGAGGLALGVKRVGFHHLALVERDRDACDTLRTNARNLGITEEQLYQRDVTQFPREQFYEPFKGRIDLLAGGAPCQPFSLGGLQRGDSDRRNLFPYVFHALRELMPDAILLENVRNLAGRSFLPYFKYIVQQLRFPFVAAQPSELWQSHYERLVELEREKPVDDHDPTHTYAVDFAILNAADYGVPQIRHRVFMVGFRRDLGISPSFPLASHSEDALLWAQWGDGSYWAEHDMPAPDMPASVLKKVARLRLFGKPDQERWRTLRDVLKGLPEPCSWPSKEWPNHFYIAGARVYPGHTGSVLDRPAKAIKAGDHGNPGGEHVLIRDGDDARGIDAVRYLSVRECARVQTFPDDYLFCGSRSEMMRQLGNAVPVELAEALASIVRDKLAGVREQRQAQGVGLTRELSKAAASR